MNDGGREDHLTARRPEPLKADTGDPVERAVQALQAGAGQETFEPIYKHYYRPLYYFFAKQPLLRDEADDLAQDTLWRAFDKLDQFRVDPDVGQGSIRSSFEAWLRRIAENVWKNAVRARTAARRGGAVDAVTTLDDEAADRSIEKTVYADASATPEQRLLDVERTRILREALEKLPPGMRRCTELRLAHDFKYQEIADVTGIGLNSVRSQLFEARKRLRPILDRYFSNAGF